MTIKPYNGTNETIEEIADSVRRVIADKSPHEALGRKMLQAIVDSTGGQVLMAKDPSQQEIEGGSLIISGEAKYSIFLSPFTTPLRDNFTIAHELGHFFLHYMLQKPRPTPVLNFTRYGTGLIEWQANRFAAALLMPKELFKAKCRVFQNDAFRLSGYFEVSRPAVEARMEYACKS